MVAEALARFLHLDIQRTDETADPPCLQLTLAIDGPELPDRWDFNSRSQLLHADRRKLICPEWRKSRLRTCLSSILSKTFQAGPGLGFFTPAVSNGRQRTAVWFRFTGSGKAAVRRFGDGLALDLRPPNATSEALEWA